MNETHPFDSFLRTDRLPHMWCPGCGIGTVLNAFIQALTKSELPLDDVTVVSGIGCSGRVAGYLNLDSFHTTHGRAIPFATGLKLANPKLKVVVFSGEGDLISIGGNHFIHAARRNQDMVVICINNFNYSMTGGQVSAATPYEAMSSTTPYLNHELPFNLPHLADACGATYVARYTSAHPQRITKSIREAFDRSGFSFIEIITPCPTLYGRMNRLGDGLQMMKDLKERSVVKNGKSTRDIDIGMEGEIVIGRFVDIEKPAFYERIEKGYIETFGDRYRSWREE